MLPKHTHTLTLSLPPSAIGIEQMQTKSKVNLFNLRSFDHLSKPHAQHLSNSLSPKVASLLRRRSTRRSAWDPLRSTEIHSDRRSSALASFYSLSLTPAHSRLSCFPLSLSLSLTVCLFVCFSVCLLVAWYVCLFCFGKNRKATQ